MMHAIELGSRRILQPGPWRWLRALAWAIALAAGTAAGSALPAIIPFVIVGALAGVSVTRFAELPGQYQLLGMAIWAVALLACYAALVRLGEDRRPSELAFRPALPELAAGLAIGAAMMAAAILLLWLGGWITIAATLPMAPWRWLTLAVESGTLEELAFRAILLRLLWRAFGPWAALAISATVFGVGHIFNPNSGLFEALCVAIPGVTLAAFYVFTGRLWTSIGVHAGWNFAQGWVFGAAVSGFSIPERGPIDIAPIAGAPSYLSGGDFGPEASLAGLLVGTSVGALTLWLAWKRGRLTEPQREADPEIPAAALPDTAPLS